MKIATLPRPAHVGTLAALIALSLGLSPVGAQAQDPAPVATSVAGAKVSGQDVPVPARKKYVAPEYPLEAAAQGIRGIVILNLLIGEDGRVESATVTRSIKGLDEAALAAVRLWEYEPTKVAGKPVKVLHSQGITFTMKLPDLQRAPGVPELRSGGSPPIPVGLTAPASATVEVTLGAEGEVQEAAVIEGDPAVSEGLLRVVRSWRFVLPEGAAPPSFSIRAEWKPGPPAVVALTAADPRSAATAASLSGVAPAVPPVLPTEATPSAAPASQTPSPAGVRAPSPSPASLAAGEPVDTEVLPARPEPPAREEGMSMVADVVLGENIPELVRGRRPVWPPLARLGNVTGEVVVRFSVDLAGKVTVHSAEGTDLLKATAEQAAATWMFRRTAIDRLNLIATFSFTAERAVAKVQRAP